jgi:hypothetical protein
MSRLLEDYVGIVAEDGIKTNKNAEFGGSLTVTGAITAPSGITGPVAGALTPTSYKVPTEVVIATNVIDAAETGKTFFLNSATAFVSTLPAPAAGLNFKFIMGATGPSGGNHTVVTAASANIIAGNLLYGPTDDAGTVDADADTLTFVASQAVPGDFVEVISDGTNYFVVGVAAVAEGITITKAG